MLTLSSAPMRADGTVQDSLETLADAHRQISNLLREMPAISEPEVERLGLAGALHEVVEGELAGALDGVTWEVAEQAESKARALSPLAAEVLFYAAREAMRNAARHGRDRANARPLHLWVRMVVREPERDASQRTLEVRIEDDGVGLGNDLSDRTGQGLALHSTMMAVVGGTLAVERRPEGGTRVQLTLPVR
jgi:signal transduction histidine kinase